MNGKKNMTSLSANLEILRNGAIITVKVKGVEYDDRSFDFQYRFDADEIEVTTYDSASGKLLDSSTVNHYDNAQEFMINHPSGNSDTIGLAPPTSNVVVMPMRPVDECDIPF